MKRTHKNNRKEIRLQLVQCWAVLMAVCYVLSPLHNQVGDLMHMISHELESPEYVIAHADQGEHNFEVHLEHKVQTASQHEHAVISFVKSFLESSGSTDPFHTDQKQLKLDIDKHLNEYSSSMRLILMDKKKEPIYTKVLELHKGYLSTIYIPPRIS